MDATYTKTAIRLHWAVALGLAGTFALGVVMHELPLSPDKLKLYSWHKWAGVSVFLLALARLGWRAGHQPPAAPQDMAAWQLQVAEAVHGLLYLLMIAIPLSGWLMSSAKGYQTVWFGLLPLPDLLEKDTVLGDQLTLIHKFLNFGLLGLVLAHTGAALKHHFIDRDGVLARMVPILK